MLTNDRITTLLNTLDSIESGIILLDGPSGSGKSTLLTKYLKLLSDDNAKTFAYIPQQGNLFSGSIAENIKFFRNIQDVQLKEAMIGANLNHINVNLEINSGGEPLSGGERQRLIFARALLASNKNLIVIDEGFSAMDEKNCYEIFNRVVLLYKKIVFTTHSKELKSRAEHIIAI